MRVGIDRWAKVGLVAVLVFVLGACAPVAKPATPKPTATKYVRVIDSTGNPSIAKMKAAHVVGIIGYTGYSSWKTMTRSRVVAWHKNGIAIGSCYETTAGWMNGGYAAGKAAMKKAIAYNVSIGLRKDTPVYFACDFDAPAHSSAISACLRGGASVHPLGKRGTGLYAGYGPIAYNLQPPTFKLPSPAKIASDEVVFETVSNGYLKWQTAAWSYGKRLSGINLYQHIGNPWGNLGGDYDANDALPYWGQEGVIKPAPTPKPAPKPVPARKTMIVNVRRMKVYNATLRTFRFFLYRHEVVSVGPKTKFGGIPVNWHGKTGWAHQSDLK